MDAPDFDALSAAAYGESSTIDDLNALWGAALRLERWHFIARGTPPDVHPYIARNPTVGGGEFMLKAFTDPSRLESFARENGLTDEDGQVTYLSLPVDGLLGSLDRYAELGVGGIHFNADSGSNGFFAPLRQVPAIVDHLRGLGLLS